MARAQLPLVSKETIVRLASIIVDPNASPESVSKALTELVLGISAISDSPKMAKNLLDEGKVTPSTYMRTKSRLFPPYEEVVDTVDRVINVYGKLED